MFSKERRLLEGKAEAWKVQIRDTRFVIIDECCIDEDIHFHIYDAVGTSSFLLKGVYALAEWIRTEKK